MSRVEPLKTAQPPTPTAQVSHETQGFLFGLLGVLIFYHHPIIGNLVTWFTTTNAFGGDVEFVGLDNYRYLLGDRLFQQSIVTFIGFSAFIVPATRITLPPNQPDWFVCVEVHRDKAVVAIVGADELTDILDFSDLLARN